jgi:hypothetical protein
MATVPFSASVMVLDPVVGAPDVLSRVSLATTRVGVGILLELTNHIAVVAIAVVIYPVLERVSARLAMGYVAARSIEAVLFAAGTASLLTLVVVSREFLAMGSPADGHFQTWAQVLLAGHDWNNAALAFVAFALGSLTLNYGLYRARLVPRWISAWGLLAAASILSARVALLVGAGLNPRTVTMLDAPIFLQEMVFALWLIVRGFDSAALATVEVRQAG